MKPEGVPPNRLRSFGCHGEAISMPAESILAESQPRTSHNTYRNVSPVKLPMLSGMGPFMTSVDFKSLPMTVNTQWILGKSKDRLKARMKQ
jgi:hypothetical protein